MPTISQTFEHTLSTNTTINSTVYNYLNKGTTCRIQQEMSDVFYKDLKVMLEQTEIESLSFPETYEYTANGDCPYFEVFGLQFPLGVMQVNNNCYRPAVFRTGGYSYESNLIYTSHSSSSSSTAGFQQGFSISKEKNLDLYYTLTIDYNDNLIIASYSTIMGIKSPILCFIKGTDFNGKDVVYISGNCNAACADLASSHKIYHRLVWSESWYSNPYSGQAETPSNDNVYPASKNYNDRLFVKPFASDMIGRISSLDNKIQMMQPICCGGRVTFDNLYTVPDTVNTNAYYTINGETYYCPGDHLVTLAITNEPVDVETYGLRFLVKL